MVLLETIVIAVLSQLAPSGDDCGYLGGVVVRADSGAAVVGAEVVLSARRTSEFVPMAKTVTDENGKFLFADLPILPDVVYKTGANWGGIHYPGQATRLTPARTTVGVKLTVNEPITEPNPLVMAKLDVTIRSKPGFLEVSEVMTIENPTLGCYIGKSAEDDGSPETLCLGVPAGFEQITFDDEFYGRRFNLVDGRLVTAVPWTPGTQELRYTYVLRSEQRQLAWTRPLELPCRDVTVRIVSETPDEIECSLSAQPEILSDSLVYRHTGPQLEAGRQIEVCLGRQSVSALAYGKWGALILLGVLVTLGVFRNRRRRAMQNHQDAASTETSQRRRTRGKKTRSVPSSN